VSDIGIITFEQIPVGQTRVNVQLNVEGEPSTAARFGVSVTGSKDDNFDTASEGMEG
jgi:hypothetical protein